MKPKYITPRICIATIGSQVQVQKIKDLIVNRHKQYHHFFNLTKFDIEEDKESGFKWRGSPFSITQTIKMLTLIDTFLRMNLANSAIICVSDPTMETYALFAVKTYLQICYASISPPMPTPTTKHIAQVAQKLTNQYPYLTLEISQIYQNIQCQNPPIKYLESLEIEPSNSFIPLFQIYTESRYNDFELVYSHNIEEVVGTYYLDLNQPLETGIGTKYYDSKPETKYFSGPVAVAGDVKIKIFSYKYLKKIHEFTIGFNTLNIDTLNHNASGLIIIQNRDIYQRNKDLTDSFRIKMEYSSFCSSPKCSTQASCSQCLQLSKKIRPRYTDIQQELYKLHRVRTQQEVQIMLSL